MWFYRENIAQLELQLYVKVERRQNTVSHIYTRRWVEGYFRTFSLRLSVVPNNCERAMPDEVGPSHCHSQT